MEEPQSLLSPAMGLAVASPISDSLMSMGSLSSYRVGACRMMPAVPTSTATVKIHRKRRSRTIATYFQSSMTCKGRGRTIEGRTVKSKRKSLLLSHYR